MIIQYARYERKGSHTTFIPIMLFVEEACSRKHIRLTFNPLNAELNPICHLLALLGGHHILHVGRIRVKNRASYI